MPKVRKPKEKEIEAYANRSHDQATERKRKKQSRICISLFDYELEKLRELAEEDQRSISSFIRTKIIKTIRES